MKRNIAAAAAFILILPMRSIVAQGTAKHAVTPEELVDANGKEGTRRKAG